MTHLSVWAKSHTIYVFIDYALLAIKSSAGRILYIRRVHARHVQKSCVFIVNKCCVFIVVSLLLTKAQYLELDEHIFPYSFLNVEYTSSPRGVRILAGTNIWYLNRTSNSELWGRWPENWTRGLLTVLLHSLATCFQWGYSEPSFKNQIVNFHISDNITEENIMYQQLQKICKENVRRIIVSRGNLGKRILCTRKTLPATRLTGRIR